jgi:hypothetical protein
MADRMASQKKRTAREALGESLPDLRGQAPPDEGKTYDVRFSGRLTADDRAALKRPGFMLNTNAFGVFAPDVSEATARLGRRRVLGWRETTYHVVRLAAESPDDARQQVVDALGREPDDLRVS